MRIAAGLAVAVALAGSPALTQSPPDLTGTWTAVKDAPPDVGAAPSPVLGQTFAVRQSAGELTMSRPWRDDVVTVTYRLDGSRTHYRVPGRMCEGDQENIETMAVEEGQLALTLVGAIPPGATETRAYSIRRQLRRIDADTVVVQTSITQQGKPVPVGTVYKRAATPMDVTTKSPAPSGTPARITQLAWLTGDWVGASAAAPRPGGPPPASVEERWSPIASGSMQALARTTRGSTLVSFEFLCLSERNGTLVYTAMPDGRTTPTHFTLTAITADSATFENPAHDFPRAIRYTRRADGTLEAAIGRGPTELTQTFVFRRQD